MVVGMQWQRVMLLSAIMGLVACGDDEPADVAGNYAVNVTSGNNGCSLQGFNSGASISNVPLLISQNGHDVNGTVGGGAGVLLNALLGSNRFEGQVDEDEIHMEIYGTRAATQGNCTFTINTTLRAVADGDFLQGTLEYTRAGNGNPDCAALVNCVSVQTFNGSRPPQP